MKVIYDQNGIQSIHSSRFFYYNKLLNEPLTIKSCVHFIKNIKIFAKYERVKQGM